MSGAFDPYYTWLGIPPAEQPPHHYRLLGIAVFESSPTVIENASDRLMLDIRARSMGSQGRSTQPLLNQIAAARACLLDPVQKNVYDMELYRQQTQCDHAPPIRSTSGGDAPAPSLVTAPTPQFAPQTNPKPFVPRRNRGASQKEQNAILRVVLIAGGGVLGIFVALFLLAEIKTQERERAEANARRSAQPVQRKVVTVPARPRQQSRPTPKRGSPPQGKETHAIPTAEPNVFTPSTPERAMQQQLATPPQTELDEQLPTVPQLQTQPQPELEEPRPTVAQLQTQLDHTDPDKRAEAANALAKMGSNASPAVADLIAALDDVFPKVQIAAIEALAAMGGDAEPAIRPLYELVLKTTDDYQRGQLVMAITSINPKCNELRLIVEKAIEGVSKSDINSTNELLLANRLWACKHVATLGPEAKWAEPILGRLLRVTGKRLDLRKNVDVFQACTDALIAINANHGLTISLLEGMSRGRGLSPSTPEAMQAADTALRKLKQ